MAVNAAIAAISAAVPERVLELQALRQSASGVLGTSPKQAAGTSVGAISDSTSNASRVQLLGGQFQSLATRDALTVLESKLTALNTAAQNLSLSGSSGVFTEGGSAWSSDSKVVRIDATPTNLSAPIEVNVVQLANSTTGAEAIIEINGKQYTSDTNQFTDAGGISGLDLTVLRTTTRSATSTTVTPGTTTTTFSDPVTVESFNQSSEKLRLDDDDDVEFDTGDAVRVFNNAVPGLSNNTTYYARVDGDDLRLYSTQEQALDGGSEGRIDLGTGSGGGFEDVSGMTIVREITTTTPDVVTTTVRKIENPVTISPGGDADAVAEAIAGYVTAYNDLQAFLAEETAPDGALAGESAVSRLDSELRRAVSPLFRNSLPGLVQEDRTTSQITVDATRLDQALTTNFQSIVKAFTESTSGVAARTSSAITPFLGAQGIVATRSAELSANLSSVDVDKLRDAQSKWEEATSSFDSMAEAMLAIQDQTEFLNSLTEMLR